MPSRVSIGLVGTLAFIFVFGPMYLIFRSMRLPLISIVPNVLICET